MTTTPQLVYYRTSDTRTAIGVITFIVDGDIVNLVAFCDTEDDWPVTNIPSTVHPAHLYPNVAKGPGVGQWQEADLPVSASVMTAIAAAAIAAGYVAVPTAGTSPARTKDAVFTPSADHGGRPVRLTVTGMLTCTSTLIAPETASIELRSDSTAAPTTKRADQSFTLSGVVATLTVPFFLSYDVPPGDTVKLVTGGQGAVAITSVNETVL